MIKQKKFPNNFAIAGVTALMYNVHLDILFDVGSKTIKEEFYEKVSDVGFEWKEHQASEWNHASIYSSTDPLYFIYWINDGSVHSYDNYMYKSYNYSNNYDYVVYPTRVIIKNLQKNTSYDLRSYYVCEGNTVYYNAQTITTLSQESNISFKAPVYDSSMDGKTYDKDLIENNLRQVEEIVSKIYNMFFYGNNTQYDIIIKANVNYAAAAAGTEITYNYTTLQGYMETIRSTTIHELAHCNMNGDITSSDDYKDNIIKFMEFATNAPYAIWKWMAGHNYPVISSESYDYMDDCLVVAACEWSNYEFRQ